MAQGGDVKRILKRFQKEKAKVKKKSPLLHFNMKLNTIANVQIEDGS